ncbi:MAG TPA: hypothetical protein VKA27_16645, partial [Sunxiuqinia sp.]|nr:hypothetical protein [Sunxiuqinia sp.]
MIVPMEKYSFVLYHKAYTSFLDELQELGVVHIDVSRKKVHPGEEEDLIHEAEQINKTFELLKPYQHAENEATDTGWTTEELNQQSSGLTKKLEAGRQKLAGLQEEKKEREDWGEYSVELL